MTMATPLLKRTLKIGLLALIGVAFLVYTSLTHARLVQQATHRDVLPPSVTRQGGTGEDSPPGGEHDSPTGDFYQLDDQEIYIYSAFWDHRFSERERVRLFGLQMNGSTPLDFVCNFYFTDEIKSQVPLYKAEAIYRSWPSHKMKYLAHYYECKLPQSVGPFDYRDVEKFSLQLQGRSERGEIFIPVTHVGLDRHGADVRDDLAICVDAIWGNLDPARLVEWVEFNLLLGVQKIVFYDTTTVGPAARVLQHYVSTGTVDVIQYTYAMRMSSLMQDDPMRRQLTGDDMMMEQTYLVSANDCLYRYRDRYKYISVLDIDEIIVPSNPESLPKVIQRARAESPKAVTFAFSTAWHFQEYDEQAPEAVSTPSFLHMQKHLRRSPVLRSQPRSVVVTDHFYVVNWHNVVIMPVGMDGNKYLDYRGYGCVHNFRHKCTQGTEKCRDMAEKSEVDGVIPLYAHLVKEQAERTLAHLKLLSRSNATLS